MEPQGNSRLQELVAAVAGGETHTRGDLYTALVESELIVPTQTPPSHPTDAGATLTVNVLCARDHEGRLAAGVFTSSQALVHWMPKGCSFIQAAGASVFAMLAAMPIERVYIDWGNESNVMLSLHEVQALARGASHAGPDETFDLPPPDQIRISKPSVPLPAKITDALVRLVQAEPRIAFAYLPKIEYSHIETQSRIVLVLVPRPDVPGEQIEEAVDSIGDQAQELLPPGEPLDIMTLPPAHELLSLVMRTGAELAINDRPYHQRLLGLFAKLWAKSA